MKLISIFFLPICFIQLSVTVERHTIWSVFNQTETSKSLNDEIGRWREEIRKEFLEALKELPEKVKTGLLKKAYHDNKDDWQSLKASEYLDFMRNGDRARFEGHNFARRHRLSNLVIGELVENKGTFMDQIANGLWLTLEESTWVWPAHIGAQHSGIGLPDPSEQYIDLGVGETTGLVSWVKFLVGDKLKNLHKIFPKRIDYELHRRVVQPYLARSDWWWQGFKNQAVNNWNIWINFNLLQSALLAIDEDNNGTRFKFIEKIVQSADKFVDGYSEDGGCDEGPNYWTAAGGNLIHFLSFLHQVSNGKMSWSQNKLIRNIGDYIYKMHIDKNYFVNFADAGPTLIPPVPSVYEFGSLFKDKPLLRFSAYLNHLSDPHDENRAISSAQGDLSKFISVLMTQKALKHINGSAPMLQKNWLPSLQVVALRCQTGSPKGLFFASKGGTNGESHNHNDIGNFVLYVNGKPGLIDVGVGTYTKQTFDNHRYELWYMQSQYHNCPTLNGYLQHEGGQFKARNVKFAESDEHYHFKMDIAEAYPATTNVKAWTREFLFDPKNHTLLLTEDYQFSAWNHSALAPFVVHFMTVLPAEKKANGVLHLQTTDSHILEMTYDTSVFADVLVEEKVIKDTKLQHYWGKSVTRLNLVAKKNLPLKGDFLVKFKLI